MIRLHRFLGDYLHFKWIGLSFFIFVLLFKFFDLLQNLDRLFEVSAFSDYEGGRVFYRCVYVSVEITLLNCLC